MTTRGRTHEGQSGHVLVNENDWGREFPQYSELLNKFFLKIFEICISNCDFFCFSCDREVTEASQQQDLQIQIQILKSRVL